jgi:DNA helicase-2/ATP-dependent DNA helicase PcrA
MEFKQRYTALNERQKQAVDTIDGPVMVVAGPGTGKTELLSVRTANIIAKTDTLPSAILCLTFTDNAARNMRERLVGLMGAEGYKVAIHTFHSFGSEVMNRHSQFFYHGAHFKPADELSTHEILTELLQKLPHDNPLASTMNGEFTYIKDVQRIISDMKRSGYTPDEINSILDRNDAFTSWVLPKLQASFAPTMSKKQFDTIAELIDEIAAYDEEPLELIGYHPLYAHIHSSLGAALQQAQDENSTKPLSAWKKSYLYKNEAGEQALRDSKKSEKLRAATKLYYEYLIAMQERALYDYDDMILRVVHAMEVFNELRYELQESYQYIMVDEFQDTNEAQMRMLWNLTNHPAQEQSPNILVVGDDDQAIYRFQGADMSNILDFTTRYRDVKVITLTDNYRSVPEVIDAGRHVVTTISERLETTLEGVDKTLTPHYSAPSSNVDFVRYPGETDTRHHLAQAILASYKKDSSATRAVIARNHRQLLSLLPHLEAAGIPLRYELQENCLDSEPVQQLELVSRIVMLLSQGAYDEVNELLPELLSHPAWAIPAKDLWRLGIGATKQQRYWLEEMLENEGKLQSVAEWLIVMAHLSLSTPLETMIDTLFGVGDSQSADESSQDEQDPLADITEELVSPYRAYFFPSEGLDTTPTQYVVWLHTLQQLRAKLRDYRSDNTLRLTDFVRFIDMHRDAGIRMQAITSVEHDDTAITLLTAHKSKGLEFDEVYVLDASEHVWGEGARSRGKLIQFPSNMPLSPAGENSDERLRLLFVAITRARRNLTFVSSRELDNGKTILPVAVLHHETFAITDRESTVADTVQALRDDWKVRVIDVDLATKEQILRPLLQRYKLSATHLNNFLNIPSGGPELFLLHNLLRFPQAMSPSAAYGSAIHLSLQRAHAHLSATGKKRPVEDILNDFEAVMAEYQLTETERMLFTGRGTSALTAFLDHSYDSFTPSQVVERSFSGEVVMVGDARITGAIDLLDIDDQEKTIFITDYKTGKAASSWRGTTDYEKIKLHHYEQQLMMYKLLIEGSEQFLGYTVTGGRISFVEPAAGGKIVALDYQYDGEKIDQFKTLINAVWGRIQSLNFELDTEYDESYKGIQAFEADLLK